jgi:hypothetical protein
LRLGVFHRLLLEWAEKPCVLTVRIASVGSEVRIAGVLRSYFSLSSLQGWALVPPQQHGGFASVQLTQLHLEDATQRELLLDAGGHRLRFSAGGETVFELERDDAPFTAPPRAIGRGRYLYVGGRRRPAPEAWMLQ